MDTPRPHLVDSGSAPFAVQKSSIVAVKPRKMNQSAPTLTATEANNLASATASEIQILSWHVAFAPAAAAADVIRVRDSFTQGITFTATCTSSDLVYGSFDLYLVVSSLLFVFSVSG